MELSQAHSPAADDLKIVYAGHDVADIDLSADLLTIAHAGELSPLSELPAYLTGKQQSKAESFSHISCSYCGIGDSGKLNLNGHTQACNSHSAIEKTGPTSSCVKFTYSAMNKPVAYPIHTAPSILDKDTGQRKNISYEQAIAILARQLLKHRHKTRRTLVYASGQVDYFSIFAMQEVFRLLGIRNITGNAEHCLNAGAVHNELLTGQEGPYLTIKQAMEGSNRLFIFNGWNGCITHPPIYNQLKQMPKLDAYLFDVMETETAQGLAEKIGKKQISMLRSRSDGQVALAIAHEIFTKHPEALETRFIEQYADKESFIAFRDCALSSRYTPAAVSKRCAAETKDQVQLLLTIRRLAKKLLDPETVPVVIPSVGLSQTSGVVAHCLWGNLLAMLGKFGLKPDSSPLGGVLRLPGQINAESEVQGLNRRYFLGRIPMSDADKAARRMGLPDDAYEPVLADTPRAALDYSDHSQEEELFLFFGTQFEANMPNRKRWLEKLQSAGNSVIVIDPIPDPWTLKHAELIIPSPPHSATTKLYQNGEWRLTISMPQKKAAAQTRSDATIIYDAMAEITRQLQRDPQLLKAHSDLQRHLSSGYLQQRFCPPLTPKGQGLSRVTGEVNRAQLWQRIQDYLHGDNNPLYCSFDHADGKAITWQELIQAGNLVYGGVGVNRFILDYDNAGHQPFQNIYCQAGAFRFFTPTEQDLALPEGIILNTGRSSLSDDSNRIQFATSTFNSGKATPVELLPQEHPLYISPALADSLQLATGDWARVSSAATAYFVHMPVVVSDRVKGNSVYTSFHRARAQEQRGFYINDIIDHVKRCPYTSQASLKATRVSIQRLPVSKYKDYDYIGQNHIPAKFNLPLVDVNANIPLWNGEEREFTVREIIRETHDSYTLRLMAEPLCLFAYHPGQYCSVILNIANKRVIRTYSISSSPSRPYVLELTVKRVPGGLVSNWLPDNLIAGDKIRLAKPGGSFKLTPEQAGNKLLLLGAGSGVTPLMSMVRWLKDQRKPVDVVFYYAIRSAQDAIFKNELDELSRTMPGFTCHMVPTSSDETIEENALSGRINISLLQRVAADFKSRDCYTCGPTGFMDKVEAILQAENYDMARFHMESFVTPTAPNAVKTAGGESFEIHFKNQEQSTTADGSSSLLEVAESAGIELDYSCRSGACGMCKVKVENGDVHQAENTGLAQEEADQGYTLACVSYPQSACVIS
ncbi:2Fe-2S iron-sulfur cluster-binding protein [Thalassomonas haliotis]|uniref:2Fe-2S iron-sulfur cluster binding domain-containing protein n=1 Tax=Thalassomonas haliotis TaxID=485448 RepID=A0ABY7VE64_9GAMM|nr:2Fe-2S iron-sulfur cluster-binding protein [Thalassomonas haliotis]WDE11990.1 2Fe-2S iron-sulfur cluster binding domain-containing protein [Thalassomonas haliotis]